LARIAPVCYGFRSRAAREETTMAELDREELLAALSQIADDNDDAAAEAGRIAAALLADAGLAWTDVILPQEALAGLDAGDAETGNTANAAADIDKAANEKDALVLIDRLLERKNLYHGTREELLAYKDDIAAGEFAASDLVYLNSLYARVIMGKATSGD
jgi:hypothetical protein